MTFSVIIPTLNEQAHIRSCIRSIRNGIPEAEIIVVDGGSDDATVAIAANEGASLLPAGRGRGIQMNKGAALAHGDVLLFLHADSRLALNAFQILHRYFARPEVQVGTCRLRFDASHLFLRLYELGARLESVLTTFGDQCIVVRKSFFQKLGGFPDWPLFEDVAFLQAARQRTRIYKFPTPVVTSARRFLANGVVRQQVRNARLMMGYLLGEPIDQLARVYYQSAIALSEEKSRAPGKAATE